MPGGQFTNLKEQARSLGLESRWHEVARAYAEANRLFGDIVKVTPSSKVVGDMALMMVTQELSAEDVLDEKRDIAFPNSVVQMMRGELGQPPGGWPAAIQKKVLKGASADHCAAGLALRRRRPRCRAQDGGGAHRPAPERPRARLLSDVPESLRRLRRRAGGLRPDRGAAHPDLFLRAAAGEEISVELEKGKILVIRCQAVGEADEDGQVRVFFELNGQPRIARVPDRAHGAAGRARRPKAEPGNPAHVGAPMPGVVSGVSAIAGQEVRAGDVLLSIEAMKMETALHADRDGKCGGGVRQDGRPDRREGSAGALSGVRPYCATDLRYG